MRLFPLLLCLMASPLAAHELWIEPLQFQPPAEARVEAHLVNGQNFVGLRLPYLPKSTVRFSVIASGVETPLKGRVGDKPALQAAATEGLMVAVYQSQPAIVNYAEFAKFESFGAGKDLGDVAAMHLARGLAVGPLIEVYSRYSKSLIGVGGAAGADKALGLETELVALDNPYTDDLAGGMRVQLFYQGAVRADAQVEVFEKAPDGAVVVTVLRTDADGVAVVPVRSGHVYMVDAVVLRVPEAALAAQFKAVWESLWANLTFAVP